MPPLPRFIQSSRLALVAAGLALALTPSAGAQSNLAATFFDFSVVQDIRLTVNSRDLATLRANFNTNTFYTADLQWRDITVRNVAIRSRGFGSRNGQKLGLLVDFDRLTRNQTFLGLSSLVLDNLVQDPSFLREPLAMAMFRRMGEVAPREVYCRLMINNVYQGLYTAVENIDTSYVQRNLGQSGGTLFEYHYVFPWFAEDLGDDLNTYKPLFEPQNHELDPDSTLYGPIREMVREINGPDDAVWRSRVDERLDLAQIVRHIAIESYLAQNDGILGFAGINNFYLYRFENSERHRILAWDQDVAFQFLSAPIFRDVDRNVLARRALAEPDLRTLFLDTLEATANSADADGFLAGEIERITAMTTSAALKDMRKFATNDQYLADVDFMRTFAAIRGNDVRAQVAAARTPAPRP